MQPYEQAEHEGRRRRRQFSAEFKAEVIASCQQRGVSVAAIARAHDLHPNLLRKWVQEYERFGMPEAQEAPLARCDVAASFIALPVRAQAPVADTAAHAEADTMVIELRRNGYDVSTRWPVACLQESAAWLRELLR